MKVLMFGWEFPPFNSGGLGVACEGLAKALTQQGVEVTFVLPKKIPLESEELRLIFAEENEEWKKIAKNRKNIDGIDVIEIDSLLTPYVTSDSYDESFFNVCNNSQLRSLSSHYGKNLYKEVLRYAMQARYVAQKESFDVIHAHDWLSVKAGIEAKKVSGKPLVAHIHATEYDRTGGTLNQLIYEIEKQGIHEADQVITVSQYTKDLVVDQYKKHPKNIDVVHNGVDHDHYYDLYPRELEAFKEMGYKIVLFVGRITLQKGPDYFIQAAKEVLKHNKKVIFVIAGSGDMEKRLMQQVASYGIADQVLFVGFLRGKHLNSLYQTADLYIMPSVSEPFGIVALEALVNGLPVIVSKQSGVGEALNHVLKVDFWDIKEMANQILSVVNNDVLAQTLKRNGKEEVKDFSWRNAAEKVAGLYKNMLRKLKKN